MARSFSSGTAVDGGGSAATNAATVQGLIRDALDAHAAWSIADEFTASGGAYRHVVMKCASGVSGLPKDFYVALVRAIGTGTMSVVVAEDYDAVTKILTNLPPAWVSGNRTFDVNGFTVPATTANLSATFATTNSPITQGLTVGASSFWAVIADTDHCVIVIGPGFAMYLGAITSFATGAVADPMPITLARLSSSVQSGNSSPISGMTRHPGVAGTTVAGANVGLTDPGHTSSTIAIGSTVGFTSGADKLHDNKAWAYEVAMIQSSATMTTYGYVRGKLKKVAHVYNPAAGTAIGDTYTMDGNKWLVAGMPSTPAVIVDTGAP